MKVTIVLDIKYNNKQQVLNSIKSYIEDLNNINFDNLGRRDYQKFMEEEAIKMEEINNE